MPEGVETISVGDYWAGTLVKSMQEVKLPSSLAHFQFNSSSKLEQLPYFNELPNLEDILFETLPTKEELWEKLQNAFSYAGQKFTLGIIGDWFTPCKTVCSREELRTFLSQSSPLCRESFPDSFLPKLTQDLSHGQQLCLPPSSFHVYAETTPKRNTGVKPSPEAANIPSSEDAAVPHSAKRTMTKFELDTKVKSSAENTADITPYAYKKTATKQIVSIERLEFREIIYDSVQATGQAPSLQQSDQAHLQHQPLSTHSPIEWKASITEAFFLETANSKSYFVKKTIGLSSQWQPLPNITAYDKILYIEQPPLDVELKFNPTWMQYVIRLKEAGAPSEPTTLRYIANQTQKPEPATSSPSVQPLPETLQTAITEILTLRNRKFPKAFLAFQHALQQSSSPGEQEKHIIDYCRNFINDEDLLDLSAPDHYFKDAMPSTIAAHPAYHNFFRILIEGKGSCQHRSFIAMVLCQYYGIPAYAVALHGLHAYLEINHHGLREKIDLGGAPARELSDPIDPHPFSPDEDSEEEKSSAELKSTPEEVSKAIAKLKPMRPWAHYFEQDHSWYSHCKNTEALIHALCQHKTRIFVKTQSLEQARGIAFALGQQARQQGTPHFYAESSHTINRHKIHVQVNASGNLPKTIDGPLLSILSDKNAIFHMPLFNFSDTEIANYKSLFDDQPMLDQFKSKIKHVICYGDKMPEDLGTRIDAVMLWPEHIPLPTFQPFIAADAEEKIAADTPDCYHNSDRFAANWVGEVGVRGDNFCFTPGWLPQAITRGQKQLVLADVPLEDPRFCEELATTKIQGYIWPNGERQVLPEGFQFQSVAIVDEPHHQIQRLPYTLGEYDFASRRVWIINPYNFTSFFEENSVDADGKLHTHQAGWYKDCEPTDVLCISQTLLKGQLRQLNNFLKSKDLQVIYLQPLNPEEPKLPSVTLADMSPADSGAILVEEADTEFAVHACAQKFGLGKSAIFDMPADAGWAQLIEQSELRSRELPLRIKRSLAPLMKALLAGETVLLHCRLSEKSYRQIETLFAPTPYIQLNGERREVTGKLIVVTPPRPYVCAFPNRHFSIESASLWQAYEQRLHQEYTATFSESNWEKIKVFYQYLQQAMFNVSGAPPRARISFARLRNALWALSHKEESTHHDNPTKSFFLYDFDKGSEPYAYLNVIAKLVFARDERPKFIRLEKLARYPTSNPNYHWRRANCLSATLLRKIWSIKNPEAIQRIITEEAGQPQLKTKYRQRLDRYLDSDVDKPSPPHPYETRAAKVRQRITNFREVSPILLFKGPPGSGKSHRAKAMVKGFDPNTQFVGTERITPFQQHSEEKQSAASVLFIDEVNMAPPGRLTPLAAFRRNWEPSESTNTAILLTANPERYPNRYYDPFVQDTPTIYIPEKTDAELQEIILPLVRQFTGCNGEIEAICTKQMLQAFRLAKQCFGSESVSLRDLSQTLYRWLFRIAHYSELPIKALAFSACLDEWGGMSGNETLMEDFCQRLREIFQLEVQPVLELAPPPAISEHLANKNIVFPSPRRKRLAYCLYEHLALIQWRKAEFGTVNLGKKIILIEGESGVAKSSIAYIIVKAMAIRHKQLTVGDYAATKSQLESLSADSELTVVILDELNLQPAIEKLLIPLVDDRDDIIVIATQNPNTPEFAGRGTLSKALLNRSHRLRAPGYSDEELAKITQDRLVASVKAESMDVADEIIAQEEAQQITQAFRAVQQAGAEKGCFLNGRSFFKKLPSIEAGYPDVVKARARARARAKEQHERIITEFNKSFFVLDKKTH